MKTKQNQRWIAINGSVFVEQEVEVKADLGKKYKKREAVAFNVGQDVAEHIVKLHNAGLSDNWKSEFKDIDFKKNEHGVWEV